MRIFIHPKGKEQAASRFRQEVKPLLSLSHNQVLACPTWSKKLIYPFGLHSAR